MNVINQILKWNVNELTQGVCSSFAIVVLNHAVKEKENISYISRLWKRGK